MITKFYEKYAQMVWKSFKTFGFDWFGRKDDNIDSYHKSNRKVKSGMNKKQIGRFMMDNKPLDHTIENDDIH